jgi:hypothetical protein
VTPQEIELIREHAYLETPMVVGMWASWFSLFLKRRVTKEEALETINILNFNRDDSSPKWKDMRRSGEPINWRR